MDVFENPMFLVSLLIGALALAGVSAGFQKYSEETEGQIKPKAVLRDGILGAIFTAMAWTFLPDSMKQLTESVVSTATTATTTVASTVAHVGDYDVQIGPARF